MKKWIVFLVAFILFLCVGLQVAWANKAIETNEYTIQSERIKKAFDGFRIAQISDLHNAENTELTEKLRFAKPDIIVLTGDLMDSRKTKMDMAVAFAEECVALAPTYYVGGNHESRGGYEALKTRLLSVGVAVLENEETFIQKDGARIRLIGVLDPAFRENEYISDTQYMQETLSAFSWGAEYTILLSHRPELFDCYVEVGADLVFSGHAHGGQFRLPYIGGVFAPNQGFFPAYDGGRYERNDTTMLVSRGIGNSRFPFRINNRPEIVVATLLCVS